MGQISNVVVAASSVVLLALTLWSMRTVLGPIVPALSVVFLLWPFRQHAAARRVIILSVALLTLWILYQARSIVYPTLAALLLAYLLDPAVDRLHERGVRRGLAALVLMLPVFGSLIAVGVILVPEIVRQARSLIERVPHAYQTVEAWVTPFVQDFLERFGWTRGESEPSLLPSMESLLKGLFSGVTHIGKGVAAVVGVGSFVLLTPILTYYILVDFDRLTRTVAPYLPGSWRFAVSQLGATFQESVGAWLKGQLLVAAIVAAMMTGAFFAIGLDYALLLGFLAGVLNLVPVLGFWLTFGLAFTSALFSPQAPVMVLRVVLVMTAEQLLEANLLSPKIVGGRLGVKPVVLLLTMLGLSVFLGVLGFFLAAPVLGLARSAWLLWGPRPEGRSPAGAQSDGA